MPDADWSSVSLLLPCNGADGSLTLTDVSSHADSKTIADGGEISTAQSKWAGSSLRMSWPEMDVPAWSGSRFDRASGQAYSVEFWVYVATGSGSAYFVDIGGNTIFVWFDADFDVLYVRCGLVGEEVTIAKDDFVFVQVLIATANTFQILVDDTVVKTGTCGAWSGEDVLIGTATPGGASGSAEAYLQDVRISQGVLRPSDVPTEAWPIGSDEPIEALVSDPGPLAAPSVVVTVSPMAMVADTGPLGAPLVLTAVELRALVEDTGPLGAARFVAQCDFTAEIGDALTDYVMDLETPGGTVRVPISSWQATLQTGRQCYAQCVVPGCAPYVDDLVDATSFAIFRRVTLPSGQVVESWMAGASSINLQFSRGSTNYTAVLSGYSDAFAADEDPDSSLDRNMVSVRSISSSNGVSRVSCAIDWLLRPGMRAIVEGDPLLVGYINYYVNGSSQHMDVGERGDSD